MEMIQVPGYRDLFGDTIIKNYADLVKDIPSAVIIMTMIMLNNELNAPLPDAKNQKRLRDIMSLQYTPEQLRLLNKAFANYKKQTPEYRDYVFGRRYLLSMIIKELNNYRSFDFDDTSPQQEFNLLLAYLVAVDEVNQTDYRLLEDARSKASELLGEYRMIWVLYNQYDFNYSGHLDFEFFKLLCFVRYAISAQRNYAKEYLNKLGFKSFNQLLASIYKVSQITLDYRKNEVFTKLNFLEPSEDIDERHLKAQTINNMFGSKELDLNDVRKLPLFYFDQNNRYAIIDEDIYKRKIYNGPFFELYNLTSLNSKITFNQYSSDVSFKALEQNCFQAIMSGLRNTKYDCLNFDETNADGLPDCYYRMNKVVFLVEFKANIFPSNLSSNPDFEKIKEYIDERFVRNKKGKAKGVTQLINQITALHNNTFTFDQKFIREKLNKKITIYPIICHNEFNFSMPGINEYLNNIFINKIGFDSTQRFAIKPLTLINLDIMHNFMRIGGSFKQLGILIERYHKIIENRKKQLSRQRNTNNFLKSKCSFDEVYDSIFLAKMKKLPHNSISKRLFDLVGLRQDDLDKIL